MSRRSELLASRIEQGAAELAALAEWLTDAEWNTPVSATDRRTIGVLVHHVASIYPVEIAVAQTIARGEAVTDVTWAAVAQLNGNHAKDHAAPTKREAVALLQQNSRAAADAVRAFTDAQLDTAAPFSLSHGAPMTAQFVIEDHALRHSWHHANGIRKVLGKRQPAAA